MLARTRVAAGLVFLWATTAVPAAAGDAGDVPWALEDRSCAGGGTYGANKTTCDLGMWRHAGVGTHRVFWSTSYEGTVTSRIAWTSSEAGTSGVHEFSCKFKPQTGGPTCGTTGPRMPPGAVYEHTCRSTAASANVWWKCEYFADDVKDGRTDRDRQRRNVGAGPWDHYGACRQAVDEVEQFVPWFQETEPLRPLVEGVLYPVLENQCPEAS